MTPRLKERIANIQRLGGWCTLDKAESLAELIIARRPEKIVEIGVFAGRSAVAMAMACQSIGCGHVHGIDPWTNAAALEGGTTPENDAWWAKLDMKQIYRTCVSTAKTLGVEDWLTLIEKHDADVLKDFDEGSIQMLHIDSNHSEAVSCRTVRDWVPKVAKGGIVILDDSNWPSQQRAVELLKSGLGTQWESTHDMIGPVGPDGKTTCGGQWMLFEKTS